MRVYRNANLFAPWNISSDYTKNLLKSEALTMIIAHIAHKLNHKRSTQTDLSPKGSILFRVTIKIRRKQRAGEMSHKSFCTINTREHQQYCVLHTFSRWVFFSLFLCWICLRSARSKAKTYRENCFCKAFNCCVLVKRLLICHSLSKIVWICFTFWWTDFAFFSCVQENQTPNNESKKETKRNAQKIHRDKRNPN